MGRQRKLYRIENKFSEYLGFDIDTDYSYGCNGECDYVCRCSKISKAEIVYIYLVRVAKEIAHQLGIKKSSKEYRLIIYVINRILCGLGLHDPKHWGVRITTGYYGEEIDSVHLKDTVLVKALEEHLAALLPLIESGKYTPLVEQLLVLEYGYLLESLQGTEWTIEMISPKDIVLNEEYYRKIKLDKELQRQYEEWPYIMGAIVDLGNGHYRLIDGFHRHMAAMNGSKKKRPYFVAKV